MSWQQLKYGFVAAAGLTITGATIYLANNARRHVIPVDVIEVVLATQERCLATSYSNTTYWPVPQYRAGPLSFERAWTSNDYSTTNVVITTNIVTNAFGWWVDRNMLITLDNVITSLIPYYVDTNVFQNGTGNVVYLTVTGLFSRLGIGDRTNKWTSAPCWTNRAVTNYVVTYTNFWPSTSTSGVVVCYTTETQQAVNYASNYLDGQWIWTTQSSWPSYVTQTVHAATYGDLGWQIYPEDLQERYKVLNALQWTIGASHTESITNGFRDGSWPAVSDYETIPEVKAACEAYYDSVDSWSTAEMLPLAFSGIWALEGGGYRGYLSRAASRHVVDGMTTSLTKRVSFYMESFSQTWVWFDANEYYANDDGVVSGRYAEAVADVYASTNSSWAYTYPHTNKPAWPIGTPDPGEVITRGYQVSDTFLVLKWDFTYCTNRWW